jgi:hypothetical protein
VSWRDVITSAICRPRGVRATPSYLHYSTSPIASSFWNTLPGLHCSDFTSGIRNGGRTGLREAYLAIEGDLEAELGEVTGRLQGGGIDVVTSGEIAG